MSGVQGKPYDCGFRLADPIYAIIVTAPGVDHRTWRFLPKRFTAGNIATGIYWAFTGTQEECEGRIKKFKREYPTASEGATFEIAPLNEEDTKTVRQQAEMNEYKKRNGRLGVSLSSDGKSLVVMSENRKGKTGQKAFFDLMSRFGLTIRTDKQGRQYISVRIEE